MFLTKRSQSVLAAAAMALLVGCMQRGSNNSGTDDSGFGNIGGTYSGTGGSTSSGSGNGGSSSNGALTTNDTSALQNLFQSTANAGVTPQNLAAAAVSASLQQQIDALMAKRRQGQDVQAQLMGLAGQMLQECSQKIGALAPVPGQPLLGEWGNTGGDCTVNFRITGAGPLQVQPNNQYAVSGDTAGTMSASTTGMGAVSANPWSGNLMDTPQAGNGSLTHPTYYPATSGKNPQPARPCTAAVAMKSSANPIPENYAEATRRLGCCFRRSLMLMNPTMVNLMAGMDPRLAALLVQNSGCPNVQ
ncbi:hypothetical protein K2X33_06290 [bacterium]|nr:hypothetical protein [bacterium]